MKVTIRYRIDTSEFFETDTSILDVNSWQDIISEIESIEGTGCTVIEITNDDVN